eukprot:GILJ01015798.1.p1 GENE.GILJ01015798.1~~GILJ01015798.1.p1  ORF type:complete len:123 (-),score=18.61 GILJ01015798.1:153-521(-)
MVKEDSFKRVSVTAEKWVPLLEVQRRNLSKYLQQKTRDGYTIVGVEQTAHSKPLQTFSFPRNAVLVLGQEQSGIPADILASVDVCVEIPQLGVIRSLNAHVSASIVIWEYVKQLKFGASSLP